MSTQNMERLLYEAKLLTNRRIVNELIQSIAARSIQNPYLTEIEKILEKATGLENDRSTDS
jgi:hypothetical protein